MTRFLMASAICILSIFSADAMDQGYPSNPVRIIAPFPAGGVVDVLARAVGEELSKALRQPVIVENRPGAGGNIGAEVVVRAEPDGYTLLMTSAGIQVINQFLYKSMPFHPESDFSPISLIADMPMLVLVNSKTKIKTLQDLVSTARTQPNKLSFGSAGVGTTGYLGQAWLVHVGNMKITHVPYKGVAPAVNDLVAGHIDGMVDNTPVVMAHIRSGAVTPLAIAAKNRIPVLPAVPTSAEAGLPEWQAPSSWFGLMAPAKTPPAIIKKLSEEVAKAVRQPSMQRFVADFGVTLVGNTPDEFAKFIAEERVRWGEIVRATAAQAN